MTIKQPKQRRTNVEPANNQPTPVPSTPGVVTSAPPAPPAFAKGHPIFGTAPVVLVTVRRLKYRSGDQRLAPISTPLAPIGPERLIDLSEVGRIYGPGRYDLRAVDERGQLAWRPEVVDCPDEAGELHLVAPMPPADANAPGGTAGGGAGSSKEVVEMYRDLAKQAEQSRANDMQAFLNLVDRTRSNDTAGGGAVFTAFLQSELSDAKARERTALAKVEELRGELASLREQLLRSKLATSSGTEDLITRGMGLVMERLGGGGGGGGAAPSGGAALELPTAEVLRAALQAGQVPSVEVIQSAVKLHRAGGLRADLWELLEPLASMAGLLS